MKVRITLDMEVGESAHADAISYFIRQYGVAAQGWALKEEPDASDKAEGVEDVMLDIIHAELADDENARDWAITNSTVAVVK